MDCIPRNVTKANCIDAHLSNNILAADVTNVLLRNFSFLNKNKTKSKTVKTVDGTFQKMGQGSNKRLFSVQVEAEEPSSNKKNHKRKRDKASTNSKEKNAYAIKKNI